MGFAEFLFKTKKGKKMMGMLYGWGASVVIVGALFKIQHWPGAGVMLTVGLLTEAIIFFFSAFEPPHMDVDWTLVYPELAGMHDEEGGGKKKEKSKSITQEMDKMLQEAKIGPELLQSLREGLLKMSESASKLSDITDASVATNEYTQSLREASTSVSSLAETYKKASHTLTGLVEAEDAGTETGQHLQSLSKNLASLNAVYELQLQGANEHLKATSQLYTGIAELMENLNASLEDTRKYKENIAELTKNLQALNTIYGNMLSAMNVRN